MGGALAIALAEAGHRLIVSNPTKPSLHLSKKAENSVEWTPDNCKAVASKNGVDVVILAVKPGTVAEVLSELCPALSKNQLIISIAAGISLSMLKTWSCDNDRFIRVMPNLPAQVGEGLSVWCAQAECTPTDKEKTRAILQTFGAEIEVQNEDHIDWATALSGGGPAYVAAFLESFEVTALKAGFSSEAARLIALQTLRGSLSYIEKGNLNFAELKKAVQTKGGTTEAGFQILTEAGWQNTLESAFSAAALRSKKLRD